MNIPDFSHLSGTDGIYTFLGMMGLRILSKTQKSIQTLNKQVAVVIEKTAWHERELTRHDKEIEKLKRKV